MSRVALFFDGKNHMLDLGRSHRNLWLDHAELAAWAVDEVGGTELVAAHYYTGVPGSDDESGRRALDDLLRELERIPGFFVHRFKRFTVSDACAVCGHEDVYTREKCVDTSLVADVVSMAALNAFDTAVIFSGDLDMKPALDAVHRLGRKAWIATFGGTRLAEALERSAWGILDLSQHVSAFSRGAPVPAVGPSEPELVDAEVLREVRRAEEHFGMAGGFVGAHYFLHRWRGVGLPDDPPSRRASVERLLQAGLLETYDVDGRAALRTPCSEE